MDFGFPTSPKLGDKVTFGSTEWTFTGSDWIKGAEQRRGRAGATGATGATGPAGATGPVEEFVASINGLTGAITTEGLTFAFAGISVGASGITVDGDIRLVSGAIGFTTNVDIFVGGDNVNLARFSRTNAKVTLGDINGESSSEPTFFELDTKGKLVSVTGGVFFPANGISLGVGLTFPDGTFQSSAHAPHDFVSSFNGATGAIEGVNSFNGLTGAISTTALTLEVAGISTEGAITAEGGIALIGNVSSTKNLKIGIPGSGLGSGPFVPNTYSFPNNKLAALDSGNNPSILVNRSTISAFEGNTELEFKRIGDFVVKSFNSVTGDIEGVNSFNGVTGAVVTDTLILPCAGISGPSAITFDNGEVIRNNPDGSIQIIPSDEGGNHYGIEIDSTEWGFGPTITAIEEDGSQVDNAIRFDSDVVLGVDGSGSRVRFMFNTSSDRGLQQNIQGDGTIGMGVNGNNGHFAVIRKADLNDGDRSMSTSDKTALGMSNPQFLVYSSDSTNANDYIRLEHDQTDANIYSGTGNINLAPAGGVVGISGGTLEANNFVVDGGKIFQKGNEATTHIDMSSAQDITIKAGDDINLNPDGLSSFVFRNDGTNITVGRIFGGGDGRFISVSDDMTIIDIGDLDTVSTNSKIRLSDDGISLFDEGGTRREVIDTSYRRNTDVATFTIDASSAIATGAKTNSLYRIPYNATLTNFDVKTNATGGLTAAIRIAGPDFGDPLTSGITGCSLGVEGLTGSSTVFNQASVTAGNFILLDIFSNNSGASAAQAFLTFESR